MGALLLVDRCQTRSDVMKAGANVQVRTKQREKNFSKNERERQGSRKGLSVMKVIGGVI